MVPAGVSYLTLEGAPGDPWTQRRQPPVQRRRTTTFSVVDEHPQGEPDRLALFLGGDQQWVARLQPMWSLQAMQVGFYPDTTDFSNAAKGQMTLNGPSSCHATPTTGWIAVDEVTRVAGVTTAVTLRFEHTCEGSPPIHGEAAMVRQRSRHRPGPSGDSRCPLGCAASGQPDTELRGPSRAGEPVSGGVDRTFTKANSAITLAGVRTNAVAAGEGRAELDRDVRGDEFHRFAPARLLPGGPHTDSEPAAGLHGLGAVKLGRGLRNGHRLVRGPPDHEDIGHRDVGDHPVRLHLRRNAHAQRQDPLERGRCNHPSRPGCPRSRGPFWDVTPTGVTGNYTYIDGVAGDQVTNGVDVVLQDPQHPGIPSDYQGGILSIIGSGNPQGLLDGGVRRSR